MADRFAPRAKPERGFELCYECGGLRACFTCRGTGRMSNEKSCAHCFGVGTCVICNGNGELPLGTKAKLDAISNAQPPKHSRTVRLVGRYSELGFEGAASLAPLLRTGETSNRERAVSYLKAGKVLILTPQLLRDPFDRTRTPGSRSILTDGTYAWSAGLAYFVDKYGLPVQSELVEHMAKNDWHVPLEIDLKGFGLESV